MLTYHLKDPLEIVNFIQNAGIDTYNVAVLSDMDFPKVKNLANNIWIECADPDKLQLIKNIIDNNI